MIYFIVNPSSRSGNTGAEAKKLRALLEAQHKACTVFRTKGPGDAGRMAARISESAKLKGETADIIIFGGDGTINEVLNGIKDFDSIRVGIVPVGSGNDLARGLKLPDENARLFARIAEGAVQRTVDIGKVTYNRRSGRLSRLHPDNIPNTALFINSMGIGFNAAVCEEVLDSRIKTFLNRLGMGQLAYGLIAVKQLFSLKRGSCDIVFDDGRSLHFDKMYIADCFNYSYEGGGYCFAPDADGSDGKLNLVAVADMPLIKVPLCFPKAKKGTLYGMRGVTNLTFRKATIRTGRAHWVQTDGEVSLETDKITVEVLPKKLRLIV